MSTKRIVISSSIALVALLAALVVVLLREEPIPEPTYSVSKNLRYTFQIRNTSNEFIKETNFRAFSPLRQTSSQMVESIEATHPYELISDRFGNQVMEFVLTDIPPYGTKIVSVTAFMKLAEGPNRLEISSGDYLADSELLDLDHPRLVAESERLVSSGESSYAEQAYRWVVGHVRYTGFSAIDRGATYAIEQRSGDCTEFSHLLTALLRAGEVPARVMGGFVIDGQSNVLDASSYHNWSEYLSNDRWMLADAQRQVFNEHYENYIAFRVIESDEVNPMSNSHRFLTFDPRLAVRMN